MMPFQRVRGAENRARNKLSNGPLRAQSKAFCRVFCDAGHALFAGDMLVSCKVHRLRPMNSRWHRGLVNDSSLTEKALSVKDGFVFIKPALTKDRGHGRFFIWR